MKPDSPKKTAKKTARTSDAGQPSTPAKRPSAAKAAPAASSPSSTSAPSNPAPARATGSKAKSTDATKSPPAVAGGARLAPSPGRPAIPPILLEGDESVAPGPSGPGERFALGRMVPPDAGWEAGELPEAYGTQKLFLTARDPQWLHAHWDFSQEQLRRYNARSADRHLVLRVYRNATEGDPHREVHVHPESRSWFVHVGQASTRYVAQLGYYQAERGSWVTLATSGATLTPADTLSGDVSVWFETLPVEVRFDQLLRLVRQALQDHVPLMEALQQLRTLGFTGLPDARAAAAATWTAAQEKALAEIITIDSVRRVWMGSLEITELIRRQFLQELSSQAAAALGETSSWAGAVSSLSSPYGGAKERPKGFWFNVNAELIIYGATEPDATVTIGGRTIRLRADGTFSYRFILPDGRYELPAVATSADGTDSRSAALEFSRATEYRGDVQAHPQDPALRPPRVEHVS